ncbi:MAG: FliH/SctL family protein [Kiloniellaceae bacterium]
MGQMEKFLFDTSFDTEKSAAAKAAEAAKKAAEEPPPAPTFSEEELAAARRDAYAEGKAAGIAEAEAGHAKRLAEAVESLPPQLAQLAQMLEAQADDRRRETLDAALTVVRKLFPNLARAHGLDEIQAVVDACLERLRDEPRLVIRCADGELDALKERIEESARHGGFEGKLVFLADERLADGDLRVEWADGGAERDQASLWKEIDAIIARALSPAGNGTVPHRAAAQSAPQKTEQPAPQGAEPQSQPARPAGVEPLRRAQIA